MPSDRVSPMASTPINLLLTTPKLRLITIMAKQMYGRMLLLKLLASIPPITFSKMA